MLLKKNAVKGIISVKDGEIIVHSKCVVLSINQYNVVKLKSKKNNVSNNIEVIFSGIYKN